MYQAFTGLLNASAAGGILILAILLLRLLLRKAPKRYLCILWALAALRLVCPVSISSPASAYNYVGTPTKAAQISYFEYNGRTEKPELSLTLTGTGDTRDTGREYHAYLPTVFGLWVCGCGGMLAYAAVSYLRVRRQVQESLRLSGNVRLCDRIETPFILGVLRPQIYLPSTLDAAQRTSVLAHENAHLRRGDHWWKPMGYLILSAHWFNPLVWLGYSLLCRDIEMACDERVIRDMDSDARKAYSAALLRCSLPRNQMTICPLAFGEVGVKERIQGIMKYKKPKLAAIVAAVLVCTLVAACFLTNPVAAAGTDYFDFAMPQGIRLSLAQPGEKECSIICSGQRIGGFIVTDLGADVVRNHETDAITAYLDRFLEGKDNLVYDYMMGYGEGHPIDCAFILVDLEQMKSREYMHYFFEKNDLCYDLWLDHRYVDGEMEHSILTTTGVETGTELAVCVETGTELAVFPEEDAQPAFDFLLTDGCRLTEYTEHGSGHDHMAHCTLTAPEGDFCRILRDGEEIGSIRRTRLTERALTDTDDDLDMNVYVDQTADSYFWDESYTEFAILRDLEQTLPEVCYYEYILSSGSLDDGSPCVTVNFAVTNEETGERHEYYHRFFLRNDIVYDICVEYTQIEWNEANAIAASIAN